MGIPQGTDRMRLGPTEALRAVFVGIGRIIMAADRPQADVSRQTAEASAATERTGRNGKAPTRRGRRAGAAAPAGPRWRSLDETGNVRLLTAEDLDDGDALPGHTAVPADPDSLAANAKSAELADAVTAPADADPVAANPVAANPVAANAKPAADAPGATDLPLASYDTLSLASIRARLRTLDVGQLRVLVSYEQTNAERPEVLGMLERRIEKLETGG